MGIGECINGVCQTGLGEEQLQTEGIPMPVPDAAPPALDGYQTCCSENNVDKNIPSFRPPALFRPGEDALRTVINGINEGKDPVAVIFEIANGDIELMGKLAEGVEKAYEKHSAKEIKAGLMKKVLSSLLDKYGLLNGYVKNAGGFVKEVLERDLAPLGVDGPQRANSVMFYIDPEVIKKDPQTIYKLLEAGADPSLAQVQHIHSNDIETFRRLASSATGFFKIVCTYLPDTITKEDVTSIISKFEKEGELYSIFKIVPKNLIDRGVAVSAISHNSMNALYVPPTYLSRDILMSAVKKCPELAPYITAPEKGQELTGEFAEKNSGLAITVRDPAPYYEAACRKDATIYARLPEKYHSTELLRTVMDSDGRAMIFSPSASKEDVLRIVRGYPELYQKLPPRWQKDADIMKEAMVDEQNHRSILSNPYVTEDVSFRIIQENGLLLELVKPELRSDRLVMAALGSDITSAIHLTKEERFRPGVVEMLGNDFRTRSLVNDLHRVVESSRTTIFLERFRDPTHFVAMTDSRSAMEKEILRNPEGPRHPDAPVTLYIFPISDHNGAFGFSQIDSAIDHGHSVAYYEPKNLDEVAKIISFYLPMLREGDTVIIGGHGTSSSIDLAGGLSLRELQLRFLSFPTEKIRPGVNLVLSSCSNGVTGPNEKNMMTAFYELFDKKWHVYAQSGDGNNIKVFDENGLKRFVPLNTGAYHMFPNDEDVEHIPNFVGHINALGYRLLSNTKIAYDDILDFWGELFTDQR